MSDPRRPDEPARLAAMARYVPVAREPDAGLDDLARLAAWVCRAPIGIVGLVDADRVQAVARIGLAVTEWPRDKAPCDAVILGPDPLVVRDTLADPRFASGPLVAGEAVRFYAGAPLVTDAGLAIGSIAVLDHAPRDLPPGGATALRALARQVMTQLELRRRLAERPVTAAPAGPGAALGPGESEARYRQLIETLNEVIFQTDVAARWVFLNPAWVELTGVPLTEALGTSLFDYVHPEDAEPGVRLFNRLLAGDDAALRYECRLLRRGASPRWTELHARSVRDAQGRIVGTAGALADISERKLAESMKDEFIATVSHELRTPLTAIKGHIELVVDGEAGPVNDLQRRFLTIASQSTDRLGALVNDLLDVERVEAGRVQLRKESMDLGAVLREVATTFRLAAGRKGLSFVLEMGELPPVMADRDRLVQVFSNLVANAISYTARGEVGIQAKGVYGYVEIVVHDTGLGLTEEEQRRLFTRFFRGQAAAIQHEAGTGLGLVIVRGLVEAHGGTISVESKKDVGTRFRVILPALVDEQGREPQPAGGRRTILVVDDEVAVRDLVLEYLQLWGYEGVGAGGGQEGIDLALRLQPSLVVLDVMMPRPDGLEVLRRLKLSPATRSIPVILYSVSDERERYFELGATDFLLKPFRSERLREAILKVIDPMPVFVVGGDPALVDRLAAELRGAGCRVQGIPTAAEARDIRPAGRAVLLVSRTLPDAPAEDLLEAWRGDPAFGRSAVILVGEWPPTEALAEHPTPRIERARGRRVADLAIGVRALVQHWRGEMNG